MLLVRDRLHRRQSDQLNMLRAGAALVVVLNHVRGLFFVHGSEVESHNIVYRAFYLVTSLGHQAVMAFFVLSGYLVGSSIVRSGMKDWSWRHYLNRRLTRLWIVLIPALVLCALIDHIGFSVFGLHGIYGTGRNTNGIIPGPVQPQSTVADFFGNIFFLQGIHVPTFGANGALWSLTYEFWYYLLFPLVMLVAFAKSPLARALAGLAALGIVVFVGSTISLYFLIWLLGVAVYVRAAPRAVVLAFGVACVHGCQPGHVRPLAERGEFDRDPTQRSCHRDPLRGRDLSRDPVAPARQRRPRDKDWDGSQPSGRVLLHAVPRPSARSGVCSGRPTGPRRPRTLAANRDPLDDRRHHGDRCRADRIRGLAGHRGADGSIADESIASDSRAGNELISC